jgi:hypothetical protein
MAHHEACQLYIEQQIKEGLSEGKSAYSIGKELAAWVEELFKTSIPVKTLQSRAWREKRKNTSNEVTPKTLENPSTNPKNQVTRHGGARKGAGRPPKHEKPTEPYSCAMQMARIAISQLSRITKDDPKRHEAFQTVKNWIKENS